jgi:hypothetical protein
LSNISNNSRFIYDKLEEYEFQCKFCFGTGVVTQFLFRTKSGSATYRVIEEPDIDRNIEHMRTHHPIIFTGTYKIRRRELTTCPICKGVGKMDWLQNITKNRKRIDLVTKKIKVLNTPTFKVKKKK